LLKLGTTG